MICPAPGEDWPCWRSQVARAACCAPPAGAATGACASWRALLMPLRTTSSAPPDAAPAMTLISLPGEDCHADTAATGSMYAASSWPPSSAATSAALVVNGTGSTIVPDRFAPK